MCDYPRLVPNPRYKKNKKNRGMIPPVKDIRTKVVPIACGECRSCRRAKRREWAIRLQEDVKEHKNGHMVTLTFSTESLQKLSKEEECEEKKGYELDNAIAKLAVKRFLERWRKKHKKSVRHFLVTELGHGKTEHLHLHGIVWTNEHQDEITDRWQYGWVWSGYNKKRTYVNGRTVNYIIKYITKKDEHHKTYKPIILNSPGIGAAYINTENYKLNKYKKGKTDETYKTETGHKMALPIYYRNKLYTEAQREQLWIKKLNEQVRYVNGVKIDISQGEDQYYKALEHAQRLSEELGYGKGKTDFDEKKYEEQRRTQLQIQRFLKK